MKEKKRTKQNKTKPGAMGSSMSSVFTQFLKRTSAASFSLVLRLNTIPGQSKSLMFLSKWICCAILVTPGVEPTLQALDLFNELMTEDLPTLGKPMTPTVMEVLMFALRQ